MKKSEKEARLNRIEYVDDETTPLKRILRLRILPLIIGLFFGMFLSFLTSRFEEVLSKNIAVAFFIPLIVYLADAVGTQTESLYIRDLKSGKANYKRYLIKESLLGIMLGVFFSIFASIIVMFWFKSIELTFTVGLSIFFTVSIAPIVALNVVQILKLHHEDPALGAGPIATVVQDAITVLIYGFIASWILL